MPRKKPNEITTIFGKLKERILLESTDQESYIPNIIEFCEHKKYLNLGGDNISLFPLQRIILKTFYRGQIGNEHIGLTEDEIEMLHDFKMERVVEKYRSGGLFRELVLVLGRRCISGDTLIFDAETGTTKTIADWHKNNGILKVWTYNEKSERFEINKAETISQGKRECFRVTLDNGDYVDCTDNHPLLTQHGWKELKKLKIGDKVAQADSIPKPDDGEGLEEYEASILGYIIGDGCCTASRCYFTTDDKQVIDHLRECLNKLSDNMIVKYDNNKLSPYQYSLRQQHIKYKTYEKNGKSVTGRDVSDLFKFLSKHELQGKTAKQKRVPKAIFSASSRAKAAFLRAYFSCDGYFSKPSIPKIELYSINKALLEDVQCLLDTLDIYSRIYDKKSNVVITDNDKKYNYDHLSYRLHIARIKDVNKFVKYIGGIKHYDTRRTINTKEEIVYRSISDIKTIGKLGTYDLSISIDHCHNFIINNGLQMHNSGKDFLTALMALYEALWLLEVPGGSPFKYYEMAAGNPIYILTIATSSDQARILFNEMKTRIQLSEYFKNKIGKVESDRIWLLTPEDKANNKKLIDNGLETATSPGSVVVLSGHSNSEGLRGKRIFALLLDEVASFKSTGAVQSGDMIYQALIPATADFKAPGGKIKPNSITADNPKGLPVLDSKIISISSPRAEEGILYKMYKGAREVPERLVFRAPTWKVNLKFTENMLRHEFKLMTPVMFAMEFGAEFSGTAGELFIPAIYVDKARVMGVNMGLQQRLAGKPGLIYYAHLDPAATSHNYALIVLHVEDRIRVKENDHGMRIQEKIKMFVVDHIMAWQPTLTESIKVSEVDDYIIQLAKRFRFAMVSYDSWNSLSSIQNLRAKGIPSKMTQFRKQYKVHIYDHLEHLLVNQQLALPSNGPWATTMEQELKHLQRIYGPQGFKIKPDSEASVSTDDLCVDTETIVFTDTGTKAIKDVTTQDKVLTSNGRYMKVDNASTHVNHKECYKVTPFYGFEVNMTSNHPVEVIRNGEKEFIEANKLNISDHLLRTWCSEEIPFEDDLVKYVVEPKSPYHNVEHIRDNKVRSSNPNAKWHKRIVGSSSKDFGYLCGLYLAEGNIGHHGIAFAGNINEMAIQENLRERSITAFGIKPTAPTQMDGNGCQTWLNSVILRNYFVDLFGSRKASTKCVPYKILVAPVEFQKEVLRGYFDGDGSFNEKQFTFTTTSKYLVADIQTILLRMKIVSSISISKRKGDTCVINGRLVNYNEDLYNIRVIDSQSFNQLANILEISLHKEQSKYYKPKYEFISANTMSAKIRYIEEIAIIQNVSNLKISLDSTFVAGCINTHNCDALAGACGVAIETTFAGYPKGGTVYVPQSRTDTQQWRVGSGVYTGDQWKFMHRKFGYNPGMS